MPDVLDRSQLAKLSNDPRIVRAIENLMQQALQGTPGDVTALQAEVDQAEADIAALETGFAVVEAAVAILNAAGFVLLAAAPTFANARVLSNSTGVTVNTATPGQVKLTISVAALLGYTAANDATVVHTSGDESVGGKKTLTDVLSVNTNATPAPTAPAGTVIHVQNLNGTDCLVSLESYGAGFGHFVGRHARGTAAAPTAVQTDDQISAFGAMGYDGAAYSPSMCATVEVRAAENWSGAARGSYLRFSTTLNGNLGPNDRWDLTNDGHFRPVLTSSYDVGGNLTNRVRNFYGNFGNFDSYMIAGPRIVANLSGTAPDGAVCFVTDSTLAYAAANIGTAVVGGGAIKTPVIRIGGVWVIG